MSKQTDENTHVHAALDKMRKVFEDIKTSNSCAEQCYLLQTAIYEAATDLEIHLGHLVAPRNPESTPPAPEESRIIRPVAFAVKPPQE